MKCLTRQSPQSIDRMLASQHASTDCASATISEWHHPKTTTPAQGAVYVHLQKAVQRRSCAQADADFGLVMTTNGAVEARFIELRHMPCTKQKQIR